MEWYWWVIIAVVVIISIPFKLKFIKWYAKKWKEQKDSGDDEQ